MVYNGGRSTCWPSVSVIEASAKQENLTGKSSISKDWVVATLIIALGTDDWILV